MLTWRQKETWRHSHSVTVFLNYGTWRAWAENDHFINLAGETYQMSFMQHERAGSHWAAAGVRTETLLPVVAPVLNQADRFNGSEELVHSQRVLYSLLDCTGELNVLFWNKLSCCFIELCHGLSELWLYSVFTGSSVKVSVSSMEVKHVQYVVRARRAAVPIVYQPFPEFLLFPLSLS